MTEKTKFKCLDCKFSFWLTDKRSKRCQNCGSEHIEEVTSDSDAAQRLIDESDQW